MHEDERARVLAAVDFWINAKNEQAAASLASGRAQSGTRSAVTGGKHLAGVNNLLVDELERLGLDNLTWKTDSAARLPGYYRASKAWDLLVFQGDDPVLAVEYKSMKGSEGKNLNNRADEVLGVAEDLRQAQEHGLIGSNLQRAYVFLMEATPEVHKPVGVKVAAGNPDPIFEGASYLQRMGIMCARLVESGLYDLAWAVGVTTDPTDIIEPEPSVNWDSFSTKLRSVFDNH